MSMHVHTPSEIVLATFPGQGFVRLRQASEFIGISYQTARHHLAAGTFPLATVTFGKRKRLVPVTELIRHFQAQLEEAGLAQPVPTPQPKPRPGRPRKMAGSK